jgi:hypothetical protein
MADPPKKPTKRPKSVFRRMERWAVGLILGFVAFFLERAVVRSIRKGETKAKPSQPTALKGTGSEIEPAEADG